MCNELHEYIDVSAKFYIAYIFQIIYALVSIFIFLMSGLVEILAFFLVCSFLLCLKQVLAFILTAASLTFSRAFQGI